MVEECSDFLILIFSGTYREQTEFRFRGSILYLLAILKGLICSAVQFWCIGERGQSCEDKVCGTLLSWTCYWCTSQLKTYFSCSDWAKAGASWGRCRQAGIGVIIWGVLFFHTICEDFLGSQLFVRMYMLSSAVFFASCRRWPWLLQSCTSPSY